ncbi:hypothetical protein OUZ56_015956 [Daphnia magna]|uniref:GMP synthase n=1 Tax=Daphnia magna TaxID=35525 RepID=A0ABR0AP88_9CRUS|nr:hypothetical protein OUZ56_015956 [Daphnia magna]
MCDLMWRCMWEAPLIHNLNGFEEDIDGVLYEYMFVGRATEEFRILLLSHNIMEKVVRVAEEEEIAVNTVLKEAKHSDDMGAQPVETKTLCFRYHVTATLLPIRIVGVKGDCRTCSYCVELSSDQTQPNWNDLVTYARLTQRVCHNDFMTGLPAIPNTHLPQEVVAKMVEAVLTVSGIFRVLYDLTAKPPWKTELI